MSGPGYRDLSLWLDTCGEELAPRPPLPGPRQVDVAIVGAGFTGLWTAYYLCRADPGLRVGVVEAEVAGFGASGRNGGWCSALFPVSFARLGEPGRALARALAGAVDEVGRVCAEEAIDAHYAKGGTLTLARSPAQLRRLSAEVAEAEGAGVELHRLSAAEACGRIAATRVLGGAYAPQCAAVHPGRLVRGLARAAEARGAVVHERTRALRLAPGLVVTDRGRLRADVVVRATEGYTAGLAGHRRDLVPVYSLMVATEPLSERFWAGVGWRDRETLTDGRHLVVYGQRTADGRIAFGGRGAPYHFGSRVRADFDRDDGVFAGLRRTLVDLFPALAGVRFTHSWGGPLGVPRDWHPSVGLDRSTGLAWAGGYVGDGVAATNLAGRTLADLVLGRDSDLVHLPWVGHRSPRWEPEPLRWLGTNGVLGLMSSADRAETRTGRPARRAELAGRLLGH